MNESTLLDLLLSAFASPKRGSDFATAGFLVRLKFRETTSEELRTLHEALKRTSPVTNDELGVLLARHLFVACSLLLIWRGVYQGDPERDGLISKCVAEIGRVMKEDEILGRPEE